MYIHSLGFKNPSFELKIHLHYQQITHDTLASLKSFHSFVKLFTSPLNHEAQYLWSVDPFLAYQHASEPKVIHQSSLNQSSTE